MTEHLQDKNSFYYMFLSFRIRSDHISDRLTRGAGKKRNEVFFFVYKTTSIELDVCFTSRQGWIWLLRVITNMQKPILSCNT